MLYVGCLLYLHIIKFINHDTHPHTRQRNISPPGVTVEQHNDVSSSLYKVNKHGCNAFIKPSVCKYPLTKSDFDYVTT